jgi:uncharacterized protein (TIGR02453 family)
MITIERSTLNFLRSLKRNNNREWFQKNKERYLHAQTNVIHWLDALITEVSKHDRIQTRDGKESLYRIYNDVRFAKDKTPYSPRFAGNLKRHKPLLRGGYYFWIKPGESRIGCGFTYPSPDDLKRIREDITINYDDWKKLLKNKKLKKGLWLHAGRTCKDCAKRIPKGSPIH